MQKRLISYALLMASTATSAIVKDVRDSIEKRDLGRAEAQVEAYHKQFGITPEMLEAHSWLGRGALDAKLYQQAESYSRKTYEMCLEQLKHRPLDQDRYLPVALGAAIEVQANAMAAKGARSAAVDYLRRELKAWHATSIRTRIQKNLNLLTLEGKPAPAIVTDVFVGPRPSTLAQLRGKPVLLFFWAHWCGDCKAEVPVLARIQKEYGSRLAIIGPTQRYGYIARGEEAPPEVELRYIDEVRLKYYAPWIADFRAPVSEETFRNYGASTTPTIVLIDASGIVRLYHPGNMTYEELKPRLDRLSPADAGQPPRATDD
jgi:thiol-disulfide isomerase/thioredoxin